MRYVLLITLAGVLVCGCIGSKTRRCSWGEVCPSDRYCEETLELCLYPAQGEVCRGVPDTTPLTACTFTDAPTGAFACQGGLCLVSTCGDGRWGPGEFCDDGNNIDRDGCSADCLSDERCRNGIWDPQVGEGCDDGNAVSYDGCSSGCTDESVYFDLLSSNLSERFGAAAAYDPVRRRVVVHGGFSPEMWPLFDTWEYDGNLWRDVMVPQWPEGRQDGSMSYFDALQRVVLFGGWNGFNELNDLWSFDGTLWIELTPPASPPPRSGHGAAYDAGRNRLAIFGGENAERVPFGDHWEFDGSDWSRVTSDATPPPRRYPALAYDELRGRLVLFGGSYNDNPWLYRNDTWEFDGTHWIQMFPALSPTARHGTQLRWDPVRQRLVMYGGMIDTTPLGSSWVYDAGEWSPLPTTEDPPARGQFLMTRDPAEPGLVVRGGHRGDYTCYDDAWALRGDDWVASIGELPKARIGPGMAYDPGLGKTVMYGGLSRYSSWVYRDDTWLYAADRWQLVETSTAPSGRAHTPLAYDAHLGKVVLHGGCSGLDCSVLHSDTWTFDGDTWTQLNVGGNAGPRAHHGLAYDAAAGELVMYGGVGGTSGPVETCRFDGDNWSCVLLNPTPPPRMRPAMVYDADRQKVVLFGGYVPDTQRYLNDTWELDADGWHEMEPGPAPPGRVGHQMIYHATTRRVQLFGGVSATVGFADLWQYDGFTWTFVALAADAPLRGDFGLAYDARQREVVLFGGGMSGGEASNETWRYYYGSSWPDELCDTTADEDGDDLAGCADPDCDGRVCGVDLFCVGGVCQ